MALLIDVVRAIRNIRAEKKVEPGRFIEAFVVSARASAAMLEAGAPYIEMLARVRPLHIVASSDEAPRDQVATAVLEGVTAVVPLAGLFDVAAERARLGKQIADAEAEAGAHRGEAIERAVPREGAGEDHRDGAGAPGGGAGAARRPAGEHAGVGVTGHTDAHRWTQMWFNGRSRRAGRRGWIERSGQWESASCARCGQERGEGTSCHAMSAVGIAVAWCA